MDTHAYNYGQDQATLLLGLSKTAVSAATRHQLDAITAGPRKALKSLGDTFTVKRTVQGVKDTWTGKNVERAGALKDRLYARAKNNIEGGASDDYQQDSIGRLLTVGGLEARAKYKRNSLREVVPVAGGAAVGTVVGLALRKFLKNRAVRGAAEGVVK